MLISLIVNSKQGAARNVGLNHARGKYIQYLDADDYLIEGSLSKLIREVDVNDCDLIMYDSETRTEKGVCLGSNHYESNSQENMTGEEYLKKCEVPWVPWLTLFRKDFLLGNNISFAEGVRFEDTDYVLKSVLLAKAVIYRPINVVCHVVNPSSTVFIGNDYQKISERMMTFERMYKTIDEYKLTHPLGVISLKHHYTFRYNTFVTRTLWRLPANKIVKLLKRYPFQLDNECIAHKASQHPYIYSIISQLAKPFLRFGVFVRNYLKMK